MAKHPLRGLDVRSCAYREARSRVSERVRCDRWHTGGTASIPLIAVPQGRKTKTASNSRNVMMVKFKAIRARAPLTATDHPAPPPKGPLESKTTGPWIQNRRFHFPYRGKYAWPMLDGDPA